MIRRHVGDEFWMITQNDHAIISGELARHFGGNGFAAPDPRTVRATALHDCGWPLHDDNPTLNRNRLPLDVFETPRQIGLMVWTASAERAAREDPYAGLLVSLHSLALSVMATTPTQFVHEKFDLRHAGARFEINKFQQAQIELQEQLRARLGLRTDEPRRFGLAERSSDPRERQLIFDFRLLQAMDKLSLAVCCTKPPAETINPLPVGPGRADQPLRVRRSSATQISVTPWAFTSDRLSIQIPFRRLPGEPFTDEQTFRAALAGAAIQRIEISVAPG